MEALTLKAQENTAHMVDELRQELMSALKASHTQPAPSYLGDSYPRPPMSEPLPFPPPAQVGGGLAPLPRHPDWDQSCPPSVAHVRTLGARPGQDGLATPTSTFATLKPSPAPLHANDRNIHLPKFNGKANVDGFFAVFEMLTAGLTLDEASKARYLVSKLDGPAQAWLFGQGDTWLQWTYGELKAQLVQHFRGESTTHQRKLLSLTCGSDLQKFNEEFTAASAAATPVMGAAWVKEQYL